MKFNKDIGNIQLYIYRKGVQFLQNFFRINVISFCIALVFYLPITLMANVYRFARLSGFETRTMNIIIISAILIGFIAITVWLIFLILQWFEKRKIHYWSLLLWLPYLVVFSYVNNVLFPITYPGDSPNPSTGLFILAGFFVYPIYIFSLNSVAWMRD